MRTEELLQKGERLRSRSDYGGALRRFRSALRLSLRNNDTEGALHCHMAAGDMSRMLGRYKDALTHYSDALVLSRKIGDKSLQSDAAIGMGRSEEHTSELQSH